LSGKAKISRVFNLRGIGAGSPRRNNFSIRWQVISRGGNPVRRYRLASLLGEFPAFMNSRDADPRLRRMRRMLAADIHPRMNGASLLPPSPSPFPTSAGSARVPSIISLAADKLTIIVKCPRIATRPISELAFARARVPCSRARFTAAFKHDVYFMTSLTPCARPSVRPSLPTPSSTRPFAFGPRAAIRSPRHAGG
jgi:hypothetical protein